MHGEVGAACGVHYSITAMSLRKRRQTGRRFYIYIYICDNLVSDMHGDEDKETKGGTHQPRPETLDPVPRRGLVVGDRLDLLQARDEVHLFGLDEWRAEVELRANVENGEQDEGDVVRDERIRRPVALKEYCPARELQRRMSEGARA